MLSSQSTGNSTLFYGELLIANSNVVGSVGDG